MPIAEHRDKNSEVVERIVAFGHPNITSTHKSTFEITKERHIGIGGDCILALNADKGARDLSPSFKRNAARIDSRIEVNIKAGRYAETITGHGHPELTYIHPTDLVGRRSDFTCGRTLMVHADKVARTVNRNLVKYLRRPDHKVMFEIIVTPHAVTNCTECSLHPPRIRAERNIVGETFVWIIDQLNDNGHGVLNHKGYEIIVPNVKLGEQVKLWIKKISRTRNGKKVAIGKVIERMNRTDEEIANEE